jgi:hypothetical protein
MSFRSSSRCVDLYLSVQGLLIAQTGVLGDKPSGGWVMSASWPKMAWSPALLPMLNPHAQLVLHPGRLFAKKNVNSWFFTFPNYFSGSKDRAPCFFFYRKNVSDPSTRARPISHLHLEIKQLGDFPLIISGSSFRGRRGKASRLRFGKACLWQHCYQKTTF